MNLQSVVNSEWERFLRRKRRSCCADTQKAYSADECLYLLNDEEHKHRHMICVESDQINESRLFEEYAIDFRLVVT